MSVPATSGQRSLIIVGRIECWPTIMAEGLDPRQVGVKPGWLGSIDSRELALVPCDSPEQCVAKGRAQLRQLPNAGWLPPVSSAEILGVLEQRENGVSCQLGPGSRFNASDRKVNEPIAVVGSLLLLLPLVRDAPRVGPVTTRLGAIVVCPVRP